MKRTPVRLHLHAHRHLLGSLGAGIAVALLPGLMPALVPGLMPGLMPGLLSADAVHTRALTGWNVAVWLYLALAAWTILRADHNHVRRVATAQAEGAATVVVMVVLASLVSLAGTVLELSAAKVQGGPLAWQHIVLALSTVVGSWLLLPTVFALNYASLYFGESQPAGLNFPSDRQDFSPDFSDFLYFAFTIAVALQTADVTVRTRALRRWVLLQSVLSFVFNTAILAFTINVAASLF